jgi:hypothetical protein
MSNKKTKGQFYTVNSDYILQGLLKPNSINKKIIEPFAGKGDLIEWIRKTYQNITVDAYDIEPKAENIIKQDTLLNPPDYSDSFIITNPPYLARNKCGDKTLFDLYNTNDLYKCFIRSLTQQPNPCAGGIFIIPCGFFMSPRDLDLKCRSEFLSKYKITRVNYFEETVFPDTTTTVVSFAFEHSPVLLDEQSIEWVSYPDGVSKIFTIRAIDDWIIGGEIYKLKTPDNIRVRRYVSGQKMKEGEQLTNITLNALDSGTMDGRIKLEYKEGYVYPAKDCSRAYATLCIQGMPLSKEKQMEICDKFNAFIEKKRGDTWSLFLPQFRESKEYARKRIPFELAYNIVLHLLMG